MHRKLRFAVPDAEKVAEMPLWVDEYRPYELASLSYHKEQAAALASLVLRDDFPHLLVYGPSGAGKKTRIHCLLRELYGEGADSLKIETKSFTAPSGKKLDVNTVSSNYHIELSPGDVGIYDRVVVQEVVKQMAQTTQIAASVQKSFKVVVLMEMDQLTKDAQHALRRTMEKYSSNCRLILCGESLARVIEPLRSRCMAIRVAAPSDDEIRSGLKGVASLESFDHAVPDKVIKSIVSASRGNMRRALLMLEAMHPKSRLIKDNEQPPIPEWESYVGETASVMVSRQGAESLLAVRTRFYELLSRCIPANVIFQHLLHRLLPVTPQHLRVEVMEAAAEYEHRLTKGSKAIFHLEAFAATYMHIIHSAKK